MTFALGIPVLLLALLGWGGQVISAAAPRLAVRWGLTESADEVDAVFLADVRAECLWDALSLWTLPLGATLLLLDVPSWAILGLIGGSAFVYFAGRGIAQRLVMQRRGIRVGKPGTVKTYYLFLALWGVAGLAMIVAGSLALWGRS